MTHLEGRLQATNGDGEPAASVSDAAEDDFAAATVAAAVRLVLLDCFIVLVCCCCCCVTIVRLTCFFWFSVLITITLFTPDDRCRELVFSSSCRCLVF